MVDVVVRVVGVSVKLYTESCGSGSGRLGAVAVAMAVPVSSWCTWSTVCCGWGSGSGS